MNKYAIKIFSFLLLFCCLSVFSSTLVVNAKTSYTIPKYEEFSPNKAANDIEMIVNRKSVIDVNAVDNKISVDGGLVAQKHEDAVEEINEYVRRLNANGMFLNRDLVNVVTVKINEISFNDFAEIVINQDNINKIGMINSLKIILQNQNEYIVLNKENISFVAENYSEFKIQIKKLSDTYSFRFLDKHNNIIDKYGTDIKIALPAKHREQTVYLFMNNEQENWGGQYNALTGAMEFMTKFSGEYNVSSPQIVINDIDELNETEKQAIRFMVVRGYLKTENQLFKPTDTLTRYDFAESLVRMFFALDNDAKCSFSDVDKKHYRYVAVSQEDDIVKGFSDGTFKGKENVTAEQVIALAARTINQKNGYAYPENTDKYLNFTDNNIIEEWSKKEIALAIREGIYTKDMNLTFGDDISRKDAAVILYRLFMIINSTPEPANVVEYDITGNMEHKTFWNITNVIVVCVVTAIVNIIAIVFAVVLFKTGKKDDFFDL